ncbi:PREDICTED: uncharacterized protein LOC108967879 isoform X1 [Bactrocera latifrons]|uniref:uncharacterized protein LOC108967879 isoform X1 n=1 Tax=Bactrocera latifrons TaxID=174628 RepID=UPI0008DC7426|nr:PREDICTED: uncharacterized protein LOC108967879 isoform X1 [Bactrocera latifrons]
MDFKRDNKQTTESEDETKDDDEDAESNGSRQAENATEAERIKEAGKQDDTEDEEDYGLHVVSSVKEFKQPTPVVTLEGTHMTATTTESLASVESTDKVHKHSNFEEVMEELDMPTPSTSKVVDNVREYVRQIESRLEDYRTGVCSSPRYATTPQASAAQIIDVPRETLKLETIKGASELSFTSKLSDEFAAFTEVERMAHDEVERIVAENISPATKRLTERPDFQQVERENQEIAERFRQIMEMFDSFTKNLESLEMPGLQTAEETGEKAALPLRKHLSFKGVRSTEQTNDAAVGTASAGSVSNEFYLEVHGESKSDVGKEAPAVQSPSNNAYPQKYEAGLDPMYRDMATTISGLELLDENKPPTADPSLYTARTLPTQSLTTIGCQTSTDYFAVQMLPMETSSYSRVHSSIARDLSQTEDDIINALIIDSRTAPMTSSAGAVTTTYNDVTETSEINTVPSECKFPTITGQSALVKIREPPTTVDLTQDTNAPRVASTLTDSAGQVGSTTDAPCERTYHTIHIEANSSPSSSVLRRPPLCTRLWNVITDFCAAVCLCLQVNKDCLFCLGFFVAFVVSASFLTAFFYRTLSINPHLVQVPVGSQSFASHANALRIIQNDNTLYGL